MTATPWIVAGLGLVGLLAFAAVRSSAPPTPVPGEKRFTYRGRSFRVYPSPYAQREWVLDVGDELHVHGSGMQHFTTSAAAAQFGRTRIDSDNPPRFY